MAVFVGTNKEFHRFVGPRLRNLVQQITKVQKAKAAVCQHCGSTGTLEAAHVRGKGRSQIIDHILADHDNEKVVTVHLDFFEEEFKAAHDPIDELILILCRACHLKYDSMITAPIHGAYPSTAVRNHLGGHSGKDALPVELTPSFSDKVKPKLLNSEAMEMQQIDKEMNEDELRRKLNSVGKQVFVAHFDLFRKHAMGEITRVECIESLVSQKVSVESGAAIRCGNAKQIFDNGAEYHALLIVVSSSRLNQVVKDQAQMLIREREK